MMTENIKIHTFEADVVFVCDVDRSHVRRYLKRRYGFEMDRLDEEYSGITVELQGMSWMIYVPDTDVGDFTWLVRTLSHEANHVVLQMMRKIGVEDDETICYTQDNLLGELLRKVLRRGKKWRKTS